MHIKKTAILAVLTFMGIHLAEAAWTKHFESPEHNANSTALLECLADIEKRLTTLDRRLTYFTTVYMHALLANLENV